MNGVNKVFILGTLGSDPKDLKSRDGRPYTALNLATNRSWKNKDGNLEKRTDWHRVTVFGKTATHCQAYLKKGSQVYVEGYLATYEIEEEGKKTWMTSVTANDVTFLSKVKKQGTLEAI